LHLNDFLLYDIVRTQFLASPSRLLCLLRSLEGFPRKWKAILVGWGWQISNRIVGKELELAGYRRFGTPTRKAIEEGLAIRRAGGNYAWSEERVGEFIRRCGCSERDKPLF
jgi:hypothetical protein